MLLASDSAAATALLQRLADDPLLNDSWRPFFAALQAIAAGSRDRDRRLADDPQIFYRLAAEILWLIETLEQRGVQRESSSWWTRATRRLRR